MLALIHLGNIVLALLDYQLQVVVSALLHATGQRRVLANQFAGIGAVQIKPRIVAQRRLRQAELHVAAMHHQRQEAEPPLVELRDGLGGVMVLERCAVLYIVACGVEADDVWGCNCSVVDEVVIHNLFDHPSRHTFPAETVGNALVVGAEDDGDTFLQVEGQFVIVVAHRSLPAEGRCDGLVDGASRGFAYRQIVVFLVALCVVEAYQCAGQQRVVESGAAIQATVKGCNFRHQPSVGRGQFVKAFLGSGCHGQH